MLWFFVSLFIFGVLISLFDLIKTIFVELIRVIYWGGMALTEMKDANKLKASGFLERKKMEKKMEEADKANKHKEQILNEQNRIIQSGLSKTREMRVRYPYADEDLFQLYLKKYPSYSLDELKELEQRIKNSHNENELKYSIESRDGKKYTLADLNGLEPLEEDREDPLVMKVYKPDNLTYLLHIRDIDANNHQLFQSGDYLVIARTRIKIIEKMRLLKEAKKKIEAQQIDELFDEVDNTVKTFRNRMGYLD